MKLIICIKKSDHHDSYPRESPCYFASCQRVGSMPIFFELFFLGIQLSLIFSEFILFQYAIIKTWAQFVMT